MENTKQKWWEFAATLHKRDNQICRVIKPLPKFKSSSYKTSVIVESRNIPHLEYVLSKHCQHLNDSWAVRVVCTEDNKKYVTEIVNRLEANIQIMLDNKIKTLQDYNNLLLSKEFWDSLDAEKVLLFQEDGFLLRDGVEEFLDYDYIGAPWPLELRHSPTGVGNGGFSLRSVSKMKRALEEITLERGNTLVIAEDIYYSRALSLYSDVKMPTWEAARSFSYESIYHPEPVGWHLRNYNFEKIFRRASRTISQSGNLRQSTQL